jgi:hypothetical protein
MNDNDDSPLRNLRSSTMREEGRRRGGKSTFVNEHECPRIPTDDDEEQMAIETTTFTCVLMTKPVSAQRLRCRIVWKQPLLKEEDHFYLILFVVGGKKV